MLETLPRLLKTAYELKRRLAPINMVFGHNDLLATNFIDNGSRLWIIDWNYAGFNFLLFALANLASNNQFGEGLDGYFGNLLMKRFGAPTGR